MYSRTYTFVSRLSPRRRRRVLQWIFEAFASVVLIRVWAVIRRAALKLRGLADCRFINESTRKQPERASVLLFCTISACTVVLVAAAVAVAVAATRRDSLRRPAGSADESTETRPLSDPARSFFSLWLLCQKRKLWRLAFLLYCFNFSRGLRLTAADNYLWRGAVLKSSHARKCALCWKLEKGIFNVHLKQ
jgi:hypothetical protein